MVKAIKANEQVEPVAGIYDKYDQQVQNVLDEYWPGCTELKNIKRGDRMVYTAMYNDEKVVVKSQGYSEEKEQETLNQATYVNYIGQTLDVADYIDPFVEKSDDDKKLVTVSKFVKGVAPEELFGVPTFWFSDQNVAESLGIYLAKLRLASQ